MPSPFFTDTLTAADGTDLGTHTSDTGSGTYSLKTGSDSNHGIIRSNAVGLEAASTAGTQYLISTAPPHANYAFEATFPNQSVNSTSATDDFPALWIRANASGEGYYVRWDAQGVFLDLRRAKIVSGSMTDVSLTTLGVVGCGPGDFLQVKIEGNGGLITISAGVNGTGYIWTTSATDANITAAGSLGLSWFKNSGTSANQRIDNLVATAGSPPAGFQTAANGNWSAGATWVGGVAPPSTGATVTILHTVALDVNADVGLSSSTDSDAAVSIQSPGALTINDGKTLTCRGSIICNNGGLTLGISGGAGGATLTFDASANGSPTARHYFLQLGTAHNQTNARLVSNGVSGTPNTIQTAVGSGAAFITSGSFLRGGLGTCVFTNFTRLGTSSQSVWDFWASSDGDTFDIQDSTFDTCGMLTQPSGFAGGAFVRLARTIFKNTVSTVAVQLLSSGGITIGTRIVDDCRMDAGFNHYSADLTLKNTVVMGPYVALSNANATATTFFNNLFYSAAGATQIVPGGTKKDFVVICDQPTNPHWLQEQIDVAGVIDGAVYECPNTPSDGDATAIPACSVPTNYSLKNSILLANAIGMCPGNILNCLTNANGTVLAIEHNSYITDNNGASGGVNCGETYVGRSDLIKSMKSNLAIGTAGRTDGFLLQRITGSSVQDICLPANFDYNGGENLGTGTDGVGVNAQSGPTFFSTGLYGAHDVFGAAGLVDITVGITKWDLSLSATIAKAVAGISRSGSTVTVNRTAHGYRVGEWVTIAGATPTAYNGTWRIASIVDANNFTFTISGTPTTPATGTITITNEGTVAHALSQLLNRATGYTVAAYLAYVRAGWTPTQARYKGTAHDGGDIGAVVVAAGAPPLIHGFGGGRGGYLSGYLN